jgi:ubiquinone/menaquinone biosynthesis C-methylase UbiE
MKDTLAKLHIDTYDSLAPEYEERVEKLRAVTEHAMQPFLNSTPIGGQVLDIGCAVGYTTEILSQNGKLAEGIDISPSMIEHAKKRNPNIKLVVGDFLDHQYEDNSFDGILMYAFIHLFPKDAAKECLNKAVKILKPGGCIFIGTTKSDKPSEGFEKKADYSSSPNRFRKRWTQQELEELFTDNLLRVIHYEDNTDEFGKVWMDYVVKKANN